MTDSILPVTESPVSSGSDLPQVLMIIIGGEIWRVERNLRTVKNTLRIGIIDADNIFLM